jgi:hypothetical protein
VTGFGPAAYFIEFLKTNGLWESWVQDCPLHYTSPNAATSCGRRVVTQGCSVKMTVVALLVNVTEGMVTKP